MAVDRSGLTAKQIKDQAAKRQAAIADAQAKADADAQDELAALRAENARLKVEQAEQAKARQGLYFKVGASGGVSVYGLGRWPVTLYQEQWAKLTNPAFVARLGAFIDANQSKLKSKAAAAA